MATATRPLDWFWKGLPTQVVDHVRHIRATVSPEMEGSLSRLKDIALQRFARAVFLSETALLKVGELLENELAMGELRLVGTGFTEQEDQALRTQTRDAVVRCRAVASHNAVRLTDSRNEKLPMPARRKALINRYAALHEASSLLCSLGPRPARLHSLAKEVGRWFATQPFDGRPLPSGETPMQLSRALRRMERRFGSYHNARRQMTEAFTALIPEVLQRFDGRLREIGVKPLALWEACLLGLMRAVDKFHVRRGFRFATYAQFHLQQAITRASAEALS